MSLLDTMNSNEVPFNASALDGMGWDKLTQEAVKLETEDRLWKQAQAEDAMKLAGLFGRTDVMSAKGHQAYLEATGGRLTGEAQEEPAAEISPQGRALGGPNGMVVKTSAELRNQAEMMVRNGRLGSVQKAMDAIREDWTGKGYMIR